MTNSTKNTALDLNRDEKGIVTAKAFNDKLGAFVRSQTTQRDNLQVLIVAGLEQYQLSGNTIYLTKTLEKCIGVRSLPTASIKEYIKVHANVTWAKSKDGKTNVFKKIGGKGVEREVTLPTVAWYNHETKAKDEAKADVSGIAQLKATYTRLTKALADKKVKKDEIESTKAALAALKPFIA